MNETDDRLPPICGADLERWRIENRLSKSAAAEAFGLQRRRWDIWTCAQNLRTPLKDRTVAMLLHLYRTHPKTVPMREAVPDFAQFCAELGIQDNVPENRKRLAELIGRSTAAVYRMLEGGKPSPQVARWMEAIRRMGLPPIRAQNFMAMVADAVEQRQRGVPKK